MTPSKEMPISDAHTHTQPEVQGDNYQPGPKAVGQYLQRRETAALIALQEDNFGPDDHAWQPGRGVPIEWFNYHQQRHILLHRVTTVPTMTELARRSAYREVFIPGKCWFCGEPDTVRHAWDCLPTRHVVRHLVGGWCAWLGEYWYADRKVEQHVVKEAWGASHIVVWCMATTTNGFRQDSLSAATQDSMGVQFLRQVIDGSMRLHQYRYQHREAVFKERHPDLHTKTIRSWLHELLESKNKGKKEEVDEEEEPDPEEEEEEADSDEEDWSTDEDERDWAERLQDELAGQRPDEPDEDLDWNLQDDILLAAQTSHATG